MLGSRRLLAGTILLGALAACGGTAATPSLAPTVTPTGAPGLVATAAPTPTPKVTIPTATLEPLPSDITQVVVPPDLSRINPGEAAPGEEVQIEGSGGHIELRDEQGAVIGYIESAASFALFFDGEPIGSIDCYVNTCRGTMIVPEEALPGNHQISVEGGSSRSVTIVEASVPLALTTTAFADGGAIPDLHSCDGEDISPALSWTGAPPGAETFTVIMDDPDAPGGTWVHWIVFNIPGEKLDLSENQPKADRLPGGGVHGKNSWGNSEYGGPCPPGGPAHTYRFFLYAVDTSLELPAGASRQRVGAALSGHVLAEGRLTGTFGR